MRKHHGVKTDVNFESVQVLFVICTCVTTLHSYYTRIHSFQANQKRVIFFKYFNICNIVLYQYGGYAIMCFCEALCNVINRYNIHLFI